MHSTKPNLASVVCSTTFLGDNLVIPYSFGINSPSLFNSHLSWQISVKGPFVLSFTENAPDFTIFQAKT
jgi:hypothetical protein